MRNTVSKIVIGAIFAFSISTCFIYSGEPEKSRRGEAQQSKDNDKNQLTQREAEAKLRNAFRFLDEIEKDLEKWGHGTVAQMQLIDPDLVNELEKANRDSFHVDYNRKYSDHETKIRQNVQGAVSVFRQQKLGISATGRSGEDELLEVKERGEQRQNEIFIDRLEQTSELDAINHQIRLEHAQKLLELQREMPPESLIGEDGTVVNAPETLTLPTADEGGVTLPSSAQSGAGAGAGTTPNSLIPQASSEPATNGAEVRNLADPAFGRASSLKTRTTEEGSVTEEFDVPADGEDGFASFQSLVNTNNVSLTEPEIIKLAASANMTGNIIKFASSGIGVSPNKKAFLGVTQVSISPGWYTQEGFYAEVQLRSYFVDENGVPAENQPMVLAAFPYADAQTLDLKFSERRQLDILLDFANQLRSAGQLQQANLVVDFSRRLERDAATRTALPTIVPSSDGTHITYRFNPQLVAVGDPAKRNSKPKMKLLPTSIPVMVLVVADRTDLETYSNIMFQKSTRWIPHEKKPWVNEIGHMIVNLRPYNSRLKNTDRFDAVFALDCVDSILTTLNRAGYGETHSYDVLDNRFLELEPMVKDYQLYQEFPIPQLAIVETTPPSYSKDATFQSLLAIIPGMNDRVDIKHASLGGTTVDTCLIRNGLLEVSSDSSMKMSKNEELVIHTQSGIIRHTIPVSTPPPHRIASVSPVSLKVGEAIENVIIRGNLPFVENGTTVFFNGIKMDVGDGSSGQLIVASPTVGVDGERTSIVCNTPGNYVIDIVSEKGTATSTLGVVVKEKDKGKTKLTPEEVAEAEKKIRDAVSRKVGSMVVYGEGSESRRIKLTLESNKPEEDETTPTKGNPAAPVETGASPRPESK